MGTLLDALLALIGFIFFGKSLLALLDERRTRRGWLESVVSAPRRSSAEVMEGCVRLEGRAEAMDGAALLLSPLCGCSCLAWRLEVERFVSRDNRRKHWQLIFVDGRSAPFLIRDGSGQAKVEVGEATSWELSSDVTVEQVARGELSESLRRLFVDQDGYLQKQLLDRHLQLRERRLEPGGACTVVGQVLRREVCDGADTYREATTRPVIGAGEGRLLIGDSASRLFLLRLRLRLLWLTTVSLAGALVGLFFLGRLFGWL